MWRPESTSGALEKRRSALQRYIHTQICLILSRYLNTLVQHPIIRASETLMIFLWTMGNDYPSPRKPSSPDNQNNDSTAIPENHVLASESNDWTLGILFSLENSRTVTLRAVFRYTSRYQGWLFQAHSPHRSRHYTRHDRFTRGDQESRWCQL